jgi:hypothetical protein
MSFCSKCSLSDDCDTCQTGYFFIEQQDDPNKDTCTKCTGPNEYAQGGEGNRCLNCNLNTNCQHCSDFYHCVQCNENYYLYEDLDNGMTDGKSDKAGDSISDLIKNVYCVTCEPSVFSDHYRIDGNDNILLLIFLLF